MFRVYRVVRRDNEKLFKCTTNTINETTGNLIKKIIIDDIVIDAKNKNEGDIIIISITIPKEERN